MPTISHNGQIGIRVARLHFSKLSFSPHGAFGLGDHPFSKFFVPKSAGIGLGDPTFSISVQGCHVAVFKVARRGGEFVVGEH